MMSILLCLSALAAPADPELTWTLSVKGTPVGTRTVKVKILPGARGNRRVLESYSDVSGGIGPLKVSYRQRFTAHAEGGDPASFHSVVDANGAPMEIQGRHSGAGWTVTTNIGGRLRTADYSPGRIDLSTADLFDPESRVSLARASTVRILSAETGEVLEGKVERLGGSEVSVGGQPVSVEGFAWTSPEGRSSFWFSSEGYLVKYEVMSMGTPLSGILKSAPPGGSDDFPVRVDAAKVERIPL